MMLCGWFNHAQISPGELSEAHKQLEGMSNCTQCHELGEKVLNSKCLKCHEDIQTGISQQRGFHGSKEVVNKDCFQCHSEHHGRKFQMIRFDEANFDHKQTGYELEGKHAIVDCRKCHTADNIQNSELRKRPNTFLGLDQECLSCHDDFHQNTLSSDCKSCHTMDGFKPASNFDHQDAAFALNGEHQNVACVECHQVSNRNGKDFQQFTNLAFEDCKSCHEDPHNNQLPGQCKQCHTETSFSVFSGPGNFNHNVTDFKLKGKHRSVDCFQCHKNTDNPRLVFQDNIQIADNNCVACHEDAHEGKFGLDCAKCHNEQSFLSLNNMDFFDHTLTDYPLEGQHLEVDCKKCHTGRYSEPIDFSACKNCHEDYHQGEFAEQGISPDCRECHSLEKGFDYSLYTVAQHQESAFPLEGAHLATPCFACHVSESEERWVFSELGNNCVDCHEDIHKGFISETFYPNQDCQVCHSNETWSAMQTFDHNLTDWPLEGKHLQTDCRACHFVENADNKKDIAQNFATLEHDCVTCHDNVHDDDFAIDGVTDCLRCHVTTSWMPENFDHNTTQFPLEGKHKEVECRACHTTYIENGEAVVLYKLNKFECIDCHR